MKSIFSNLEVYRPTIDHVNNMGSIMDKEGNVLYYKLAENDKNIYEFNTVVHNFRFILENDGSLWEEGNRYLLWKATEKRVDAKTLRAESTALEEFKIFCNKNRIDYRVANRMTSRPNWQYHKYLQERINIQEIAPSTAKERMRPITSFYKWLIEIECVEFAVNLFKVQKGYISGKNKYGFNFLKEIDVVDVNQFPKAKNEHDGFILDDGKLRPLLIEQQYVLEQALIELGNIEMNLAFAFALTTGARKQSIFTLRIKHFITSETLPADFSDSGIDKWLSDQIFIDVAKEYPIRIGPNTGIDTKGNNEYVLMVPGWLIQHIRIYIVSERAKRRRSKALPQKDILDQYVFLSPRNRPYYMANDDINKMAYGQVFPDGGAINTFVCDRLKPKLLAMGENFSFKFHDMRATFAMNFIELYWPLVEKGVRDERWLLNKLRKRMGHSDVETTKIYLRHRDMASIMEEVREKREERFRKLVD